MKLIVLGAGLLGVHIPEPGPGVHSLGEVKREYSDPLRRAGDDRVGVRGADANSVGTCPRLSK
jgi:hypothetical protein